MKTLKMWYCLYAWWHKQRIVNQSEGGQSFKVLCTCGSVEEVKTPDWCSHDNPRCKDCTYKDGYVSARSFLLAFFDAQGIKVK